MRHSVLVLVTYIGIVSECFSTLFFRKFMQFKTFMLPASGAEEMKIPPFVIYTDEQLSEISKINPKSLTELGSINGIGEGKLAKYGKITLQTLNEINNNLQQNIEKSNEKSL